MTNISFQSKIRIIPNSKFNQKTRNIDKNFLIDYPWGLKNSVLGNQFYTTDVLDCSVLGLRCKNKVLGLHIGPYSNDSYNFSNIEKFIEKTISVKDSSLKGFLIGSKMGFDVYEESENLFEKFRNFLRNHKIQFSELRGGIGAKNIFYSAETDELLIGTDLIEKEQININKTKAIDYARHIFEEIRLLDQDKISW
ncbi:hypothetical protein IJ384_03570 [bacterium]|nr:hypothetical protein [bacterium]